MTDTPPDQNLWPGVEAQIAPPQVLRPTFARRRFAFTMPQLIAASLALMIASGGMVWLARLGGDRTDFPAVLGEVSSPVRPANFGDAAFDQAVADLQQTLDAGRGRLDAQTIRILETNLQAIDRAIAQCREALAADPANVYLNTYLAETQEAEARTAAARHRPGRSVDVADSIASWTSAVVLDRWKLGVPGRWHLGV